MRGSHWVRASSPGPEEIIDASAQRIYRFFNRGPGDITLTPGPHLIRASDARDQAGANFRVELAPGNSFDVSLIEWEFVVP